MNRSIRRGSTAIIVLVVALLLNATYIQVVKSAQYRNDSHNRRILYEEVSRQRGQITAAGGVLLAKSDRSEDSYRYQRTYPLGDAYSNLVGYYSVAYGPAGLEAAQDDLLSGESADLLVDRVGDFLTGRDPRGGNVELTVVPNVQQTAYQALVDAKLVGTVVAIRPSTGEILALASTPGYDPNKMASHVDEVQRTEYNSLFSSTEPGAPSALDNRAIDEVYPPGSTFKMLVASAALSQGYDTQSRLPAASSTCGANTPQPCLELPGTDGLSNYNGEGCAGSTEDVTLTTALTFSCNTAFAQLGQWIGADSIRRQAAAFGIDGEDFDLGLVDGGQPYGGLTVAGSRLGAMADPGSVSNSSIGQQDVALTPLQTAVITATIANGGQRMTPYLIARTTAPDLKQISVSVPTVANATALTPAVAQSMTEMMVSAEQHAVDGVSGSNQIANVTIASKTGTAEHGVDPKNTTPYVSYAAFAPATDPQVAVVVFIESGADVGLDSTGRSIAAPIGRLVIAAALQGA